MLKCFGAYDIRGRLNDELNEDISYRIGRAYSEYTQAKDVVVGADARLTSAGLKDALAQGLMDGGTNVIDIGLSGTEEVYFATAFLGVDGGIEVTASHNPIDYNGMKIVRKGAQPISGDTGLNDIKCLVESNHLKPLGKEKKGSVNTTSVLNEYIDHLISYVNPIGFRPLKLVVNSGNGVAGHVINALEDRFKKENIPIIFIKIQNEPDGTFPNGIPNPLLPENRKSTSDAVILHSADMGIAFDGDFDRCFLFDHLGRFIEGYYIVGLLSEAFLHKKPNSKIIHDPRLIWNTVDIVESLGGVPVMSKTGHSFIKERMRNENAIYGGEMSAHHYFRSFYYCDSGMIPWLLVAELLSVKNTSLNHLVSERIKMYPTSGEINIKLANPFKAINRIKNLYASNSIYFDETDGVSLEFHDWRFNLRVSNTEPLVRLNVETRGNEKLMISKTQEILNHLKNSDSV